MKIYSIFLIALVSLVMSSCHCTQKIQNGVDKLVHTLPIDGVDRSFIVDLPSDYDCSIDYAVVVAFHGTGQLNEKAWQDWGWKEKGEDEDFIVVYPQAMEYTFGTNQRVKTKWDDGQLSDPSNPQNLDPSTQMIHDDLAFVNAMNAFMKLSYSTDVDKFYSTGFSNGGGFVWRLAMEASDLFSGFAPHAGLLHVSNTSTTTQQPIYLSGGAAEPALVALNGGNDLPMNATDILPIVQAFLIDPSLAEMEIQDIPSTVVENNDSVVILWDQPINSSDDHFFKMIFWADTEHVYPSKFNSFRNPNLHHLADVYWDFFESLQ